MNENGKENKGWSWLGFFLAPYYYAGYGKVGRGIWFGIVSVVLPIIGALIVGIKGGLHAKSELPIGKQEFNWKSVGLVLLIVIPLNIAVQYLIFSNANKTPTCAASETKELVIDIAKDELTKNGLEEIISTTEFKVENIRMLNHNEKVDSYECAAAFKMIGKETKVLPITYSVQSIEGEQSFYVEVEGF